MNSLIAPLLAICISVVIIFSFRAIALWYWKVNRIIELLENIERDIKKKVDQSS